MEWGGGSWIIHRNALQVQVHDIVKGADPTAHIHVCGGNEREATNGESARVASGGVERIRGGLFPSSTWEFMARNSTLAKRCFRVRWIHDSETTQHVLSVVGSSHRWLTIRSRISDGREHDIVVAPELLDAGSNVARSQLGLSKPGEMLLTTSEIPASSQARAQLRTVRRSRGGV